jgi:hypothetical protein
MDLGGGRGTCGCRRGRRVRWSSTAPAVWARSMRAVLSLWHDSCCRSRSSYLNCKIKINKIVFIYKGRGEHCFSRGVESCVF